MSQRYEREIDELMHRLEGRMRREPLSRRLSRKVRPYSHGFRRAFAAFLRRPPTEQFMISAMVLVVVSFAMNMVGLGKWAFYASIFSIVFFVLGIALSLISRQSPGYQKRWRGREVEYDPHGPSIWSHLRDWFRRRRR